MTNFRYAIEKTKVDALVGEKLLVETEQFFNNTKLLRKMLQKEGSSQRSLKNRSRRDLNSHIY